MSELSKRAMRYAKNNNYYKIGKIKKYLKLFDRRMKELQDNLGVSICPKCGSKDTDSDCDDRYMYCNECGEDYCDDEYLNKLDEIESYNWFDRIQLGTWACNFKPPKTHAWFIECNEEMDRMIKELS